MVKPFTKHSKEALARKDASVVKHGSGPANPNEHWVMDVGNSVFPRYGDNPTDAFLAANGSKRPQPHIKINDCDH